MDRVYYRYSLWEEYKAGMWRSVFGDERDKYMARALRFMRNTSKFGKYMAKVIHRWPYSCIHNFSNPSINQRAWLGQAACCLAIHCPEDITRLAWHKLTEAEQSAANLEADKAIALWERRVQLRQNINLG